MLSLDHAADTLTKIILKIIKFNPLSPELLLKNKKNFLK